MTSIYTSETPDVVKNAKGLHLITQSTPNGQKVQIFLEELAKKYGLSYTFNAINISTNEQKTDYFLRINPNGRIPVLIDNTKSSPFPVHETSAELLYLQENYDKDNDFGFSDPTEKSELQRKSKLSVIMDRSVNEYTNTQLEWLFFWHGSGAPYQGQVNHFRRAAPEKIPYAIERYHNETLRVYGVLEIRLSGKYTGEPREYLAGKGKGKYRYVVDSCTACCQ